jgi:sugar O-acyltransferase (sialic acid O-acetyltransferase NeuD family)
MLDALYLCGAANPEGIRLALTINRDQPRWERIIVLDDDPEKHGQSILGLPIAGPFTMLEGIDPESAEVANLVAGTTTKRWIARQRIEEFGIPFATLVHPGVETFGAELAQDVTVYPNAIVAAASSLDEGSVILMGAIAGHGCRIGRCTVVAPNAVVNARVDVGDGVYVGTCASILPDIEIGSWATIGACSSVLRGVKQGATVIGVPAKTVLTLEQKLKFGGSDALPPGIRGELAAAVGST